MNSLMVIGVIFGLSAFGGFCSFVGSYLARSEMQRKAIAKGHARYNPETREFEWL